MATISFARHQFPPAIIRHAVWLYVRFTLSFRDVEDLLAERGLDVSYETVRRWALKFGPLFARELRRRRSRPTSQWHLDEMAVMIGGKPFWLWRAVDSEGEVLDLLVQGPTYLGASHAKSQRYDTEQGERDQSAQDPRKALHPSVEARPVHGATIGHAMGHVKATQIGTRRAGEIDHSAVVEAAVELISRPRDCRRGLPCACRTLNFDSGVPGVGRGHRGASQTQHAPALAASRIKMMRPFPQRRGI